jgi:hypothetical protein
MAVALGWSPRVDGERARAEEQVVDERGPVIARPELAATR